MQKKMNKPTVLRLSNARACLHDQACSTTSFFVAQPHFSGKGISHRLLVRACGLVSPDPTGKRGHTASCLGMAPTDNCAKKVSERLSCDPWTKCSSELPAPLLREAPSGAEETSEHPNREASKSQHLKPKNLMKC